MVTTDSSPTGADPDSRSRRRSRSRRSDAAARVVAGRVGEPTHRNPVWLLGGVLLVVASAIGGMLLFRAGDQRSEALITARDLEPGETVERDDFRIRRISVEGVDVVAPSEVDLIVGQRVVGPVPSGALVHAGMFSAADPIGVDQMDIGAALEPGAFPRSDLTLGAAVELLVTVVPGSSLAPTGLEPGGFGRDVAAVPTTTATTATATSVTTATSATDDTTAPPVTSVVESTPTSAPATDDPTTTVAAADSAAADIGAAVSIGRGHVVGVEERATGELLVTVRVARDVGLTASQAEADGRLRLVLVGEVDD